MTESTDLTLMVRETSQGPLQFYLEHNGVWLDMGNSSAGFKKLADRLPLPPEERVSTDTVERFVRGEMQGYDENTTPDDVKKLGAHLHEFLLPADLWKRLKEVKDTAAQTPVLRICCTAPLDSIPWEVIYSGQCFLGLHFQVARIPIVTGKKDPPYFGAKTCTVASIYSLLGEDVLDAPLTKKWEGTFPLNGGAPDPLPVNEARYPSPATNHPTIAEWQQAVRQGDIVHVTCYGALDKKYYNGGPMISHLWTLKRGGGADYEIWRYILSDLELDLEQRERKPLVFANVCTPPEKDWREPGFSRMLFALGVAGYVGNLGLVYKEVAVEFARRFYRELLVEKDGTESRPIARALWETKRQFWNEWESEKKWDASWLFYCLYGQPDARFELAH